MMSISYHSALTRSKRLVVRFIRSSRWTNGSSPPAQVVLQYPSLFTCSPVVASLWPTLRCSPAPREGDEGLLFTGRGRHSVCTEDLSQEFPFPRRRSKRCTSHVGPPWRRLRSGRSSCWERVF